MALLARNAIVLFTALPLLASPGWCCIGWSNLGASVLTTATGQGNQTGHGLPQMSAEATQTAQPPSCCAQRTKSPRPRVVPLAGASCSVTTSSSAESGPCRCCEDSRAAAVVPVAKDYRIASTALASIWTPIATGSPIATSLIDNSLHASGPPLRILQCVWRC